MTARKPLANRRSWAFWQLRSGIWVQGGTFIPMTILLPRGLDVRGGVLSLISPVERRNIECVRAFGLEFLSKIGSVDDDIDHDITGQLPTISGMRMISGIKRSSINDNTKQTPFPNSRCNFGIVFELCKI